MTRAKELGARALVTVALAGAFVLVLALSRYEWNFEAPWRYRRLYLEGLGVTLAATGIAYAAGLALGALVAFARMSRVLWIRQVGDLYVEVIRGTPFLVQVMIAYFGIAPLFEAENKFVIGTLALGVFSAAYIGEILRAGIESVERGQFEAARSLGLSPARTMRHVIFPQAFRRMVPPLTGELIALTKESSLLFAIGVMEMMAVARQVGADTYKNFEALLVVAGMYLTITIPLSLLARRLERRLGKSDRPGTDLL